MKVSRLDGALAAQADEVAIFGAATESFSRRNINCSIDESLDRFAPVCERALAEGVRVRGYVSVVLGCPYEGDVSPDAVAHVSKRLLEMGCYEISLGDTIGAGTPLKTQRMIEAVARHVPVDRIAGHYHDTYGQALANILASLELGVATFDCSVAGLGGCPYAPGATGNVATGQTLRCAAQSLGTSPNHRGRLELVLQPMLSLPIPSTTITGAVRLDGSITADAMLSDCEATPGQVHCARAVVPVVQPSTCVGLPENEGLYCDGFEER